MFLYAVEVSKCELGSQGEKWEKRSARFGVLDSSTHDRVAARDTQASVGGGMSRYKSSAPPWSSFGVHPDLFVSVRGSEGHLSDSKSGGSAPPKRGKRSMKLSTAIPASTENPVTHVIRSFTNGRSQQSGTTANLCTSVAESNAEFTATREGETI